MTPYFARVERVPLPTRALDGPTQSLVVTLEVHVPKTLEDDEILKLTTWAWERCKTALKHGTGDGGGEGEVEVTVGVVKG